MALLPIELASRTAFGEKMQSATEREYNAALGNAPRARKEHIEGGPRTMDVEWKDRGTLVAKKTILYTRGKVSQELYMVNPEYLPGGSMARRAKFPEGKKMTVEEVAAVVGPEFKEMHDNPPDSVKKMRKEMEEAMEADLLPVERASTPGSPCGMRSAGSASAPKKLEMLSKSKALDGFKSFIKKERMKATSPKEMAAALQAYFESLGVSDDDAAKAVGGYSRGDLADVMGMAKAASQDDLLPIERYACGGNCSCGGNCEGRCQTVGSPPVEKAAASWFDMFFKEKNIPSKVFEVTDRQGVTHSIPNEVVIEAIKQTRGSEKAKIEETLRMIDFKNGDVNHYLAHLAKGLAEQYSGALRFASEQEAEKLQAEAEANEQQAEADRAKAQAAQMREGRTRLTGKQKLPEELKKHQFTEEDNPNPKGNDKDGDGETNEKKPFGEESKKKSSGRLALQRKWPWSVAGSLDEFNDTLVKMAFVPDTPDGVLEWEQPRAKQAGRPLHLIAREIKSDWGSKVNYAAKPYLDAMLSLNRMSDMYGHDSADMIVRYFLTNARSWRGPVAKAIKAELKRML